MGKEVSHSDWLFVCKLKTNPRTLLGYNYRLIVSKIQLVVYYQCCVLIG